MRKLAILFAFLFAISSTSAQSLKPQNPYPMSSGINQATADSLVGSHYWYFYANPGSNRLTVRFKMPTTLYGAQPKTILTVTLTDASRSFRITKTVSNQLNAREATFTADKVTKRMKIIVQIDPPNQNLLRMGGDYEVEASGDVAFEDSKSNGDPVVRTYDSMVNGYGATWFMADGRIVGSDGSEGTWKAFDPENRIYTVEIGQFRWSVQYRPGYGLVRPSDPNMIVFQELKR